MMDLIFLKAKKLKRIYKQIIVASLDLFLAVISMWLAYTIRLEQWNVPNSYQLITYGVGAVGIIIIFQINRIYNAVFSFISISFLIRIMRSIGIYLVLFFGFLIFAQLPTVPRTIGIIQPCIFAIFICAFRVVISLMMTETQSESSQKRVILYGAGIAGAKIVSLLELNNDYKIFGFLDDDPKKVGRSLLGYKIYNASEISRLKNTHNLTDVLLTMPKTSLEKKKKNSYKTSRQ